MAHLKLLRQMFQPLLDFPQNLILSSAPQIYRPMQEMAPLISDRGRPVIVKSRISIENQQFHSPPENKSKKSCLIYERIFTDQAGRVPNCLTGLAFCNFVHRLNSFINCRYMRQSSTVSKELITITDRFRKKNHSSCFHVEFVGKSLRYAISWTYLNAYNFKTSLELMDQRLILRKIGRCISSHPSAFLDFIDLVAVSCKLQWLKTNINKQASYGLQM